MKYQDYYKFLENNRLLTSVWMDVAKLIDEVLSVENIDEVMILLLIYFSLIIDGNTCMSLNKKTLLDKWVNKLNGAKVSLEDSKSFSNDEFVQLTQESQRVISNYIDLINEDYLCDIVGEDKLFMITDGYLYARKYDRARKSINESLHNIFKVFPTSNGLKSYLELVKDGFRLTNKQEEVIRRGYNRNLIITGGPGTGKTTSIFFLLLGILINDISYNVYLTAPSGKASGRMKESILGGVSSLKDEVKIKYQEVIDKINHLDEFTIHRLLGYDMETSGFIHNRKNQFPEKSIFVIDEASMADICLIDALFQAIPINARVFVLGDKNQLPSVDSGAVLSDLLNVSYLQNYIIELDESKRFTMDSDIYKLANAINTGAELPIKKDDWKTPSDFEIKEVIKGKYPIFYYNDYDNVLKEKEIIGNIIYKWGSAFYQNLSLLASNIDSSNQETLDLVYLEANKSRILCAENEGIRGTKNINNIIINKFLSKGTIDYDGFLPGQVVMITKNNKNLDLYNGETGVVVTFKDDKTLYFMIEKSTKLVKKEGKKDNSIFKIGKYLFYPIRLISRSEIDYAFAITIHKSQGSDYPSILVVLPKREGHPLVNREIIYTAITRTKGNTYILSNMERLEEGKNRQTTRDTNIG